MESKQDRPKGDPMVRPEPAPVEALATDQKPKQTNKPPAADKGTLDPFASRKMFPDARSIFSWQVATLEEVRDSAFIVLDANILLQPFQMDAVSLGDVVNVYRPLAKAGRLIIPSQAVREFAKHRSTYVADLVAALANSGSKAVAPQPIRTGPLGEDEDFKKATEAAEKIRALVKEFQAYLGKVAEKVSEVVGRDPVSEAYRELFQGCVADDPTSALDEANFVDEMKRRYSANRPPGYKDANKPDGGIGDFLIWTTILEIGASTDRHCIFVTKDGKEDWYSQTGGGKPFQPRLELIEEYRIATNGKTLHMMPLSDLLKFYHAKPETVDDALQAEKSEVQKSEADRLYAEREAVRSQLLINEERLAKVDHDIHSMEQSLGDVLFEVNQSLSLPWNRAAHGTRMQLQAAREQQAKIREDLERTRQVLAVIEQRLQSLF